MKRIRNGSLLLLTTALAAATAAFSATAAPVTVTVDADHPGLVVATNFSGLSFEAAILLPDQKGVRYFRPDNQPLIHLFHTLGIKSLRIGGNSSDRDARQLPGDSDFDSLFAFAKAADVKVIYCLRLHNGDAAADAKTAKYLMDHFRAQIDCFSIGQEPSAYPKPYSYADYRDQWKTFADAIIAAVPDARFCGPSVHNNADWARRFIADFGKSNQVVLVTEHLYPGGAGGKVLTPEIGRERMLSNDFVRVYEKLYNGFVPVAQSNGLPFRLEEANNYFNGGAARVSNTFASALWGLDFMYWWASHGAAGVNFHTGDRVAAGHELQPSKYTAFFSVPEGMQARPLAYGIAAFSLGDNGRFVPVTVSTNDFLSVYATRGTDGALTITLINKKSGPAAGAEVTVMGAAGRRNGRIQFLASGDHDPGATAGITLGGAEIQKDGQWSGRWQTLEQSPDGRYHIDLPAVSAAVVRLN